ncbi:MAG: hypothetical protein WCG99_02840 [Candidatus Berkelbacteria bacterium]
MTWQDAVITIACTIFSLSLVPQIYFGFKEKRGPIKFQTSIPTFIGMYAIAITYLTLSLRYSAIISFLTGTLWLILCIQRIIYKDGRN